MSDDDNLVMSTIQIQYLMNQEGDPIMHVLHDPNENVLTTIGLLELAKQYIMMGDDGEDDDE